MSRTNEGDSNEDSRKLTEKTNKPQDDHKHKDAGYGNIQDIGSAQLGFSKVGKDVGGSGEGKKHACVEPTFYNSFVNEFLCHVRKLHNCSYRRNVVFRVRLCCSVRYDDSA